MTISGFLATDMYFVEKINLAIKRRRLSKRDKRS